MAWTLSNFSGSLLPVFSPDTSLLGRSRVSRCSREAEVRKTCGWSPQGQPLCLGLLSGLATSCNHISGDWESHLQSYVS